MTGENGSKQPNSIPPQPQSRQEAARERLAAALRENLKRRKVQARARRQDSVATEIPANEPKG